jgi:hypothetical protein
MNNGRARYLVYVVTFLAAVLFSAAAWAQPVLNPGNGHYYEVISTTNGLFTWQEAADDAETRSFGGVFGHLVTITSQQENDFLRDDLNIPLDSWIGAFQPPGTGEPNDGWSWVTGEAWSFTNWDVGEPNDAGDDEDCGQWWTSDGAWNDNDCANSYENYVIEFDIEFGGVSRATFEVNKDFTDDNSAGVEVTISCNTGLPLEQSKVITEGAGVEFVVVDFDSGEMDCEVTEDVPSGYDAEYFDGTSTSSVNCEYLDVEHGGEFACRITNSPAPVDVVIHKEWVIEGSSDADGVSQEYRIDLRCDSEIIGGNDYGDIWHIFWFDEGDATFVAEVIPDFPSTTCWVEEEVFDSAVEVDNGCGQFEVSVNNGHECTITNTVFFEGIPTLNQYGLALLALLMLGAGWIAYRRIA